MTGLVGIVALATLAALVFGVMTAGATAVLAPLLLRRSATWAPAERARVSFRLCVAPIAVGALATTLCFLPGLAGLLGLARDHCLHHDDGHLHLCLVHRPALHGAVEVAALALLALLLIVAAVREVRARALLRQLRRRSTAWDGPLVEIDAPLPFAAAVGRFWPKIVLSRPLRAALAPRQLEAVIAHEAAHARRRDALWRLVADLLSCLHLPPLRHRLLAEYALACEQACDEVAADTVGDRLLVAETILATERLLPSRLSVGIAFSDRDVEARVQSLLAPSIAARPVRVSARWKATVLLGAVGLADPLHHAIETLLGLLTG